MRLHLVLVPRLQRLGHHEFFHRIFVVEDLPDLLPGVLDGGWSVFCEQNGVQTLLQDIPRDWGKVATNESETLDINLTLFVGIFELDCRVPLLRIQDVRVVNLLKLQVVRSFVLLCDLAREPLRNFKMVIDIVLVLTFGQLHLHHDGICITIHYYRPREQLQSTSSCNINHVATRRSHRCCNRNTWDEPLGCAKETVHRVHHDLVRTLAGIVQRLLEVISLLVRLCHQLLRVLPELCQVVEKSWDNTLGLLRIPKFANACLDLVVLHARDVGKLGLHHDCLRRHVVRANNGRIQTRKIECCDRFKVGTFLRLQHRRSLELPLGRPCLVVRDGIPHLPCLAK
ncbi:hypothetical protein ATCV1_z799R [Acanthocystis turfacea chlorella virus 1]|uniref:Uncharacterized protein z799R n=1 Tax=Chlorovirus heliozoae TaxID=322019 RepID=A7KA59_9PHYC|nr:hypothetical protein ATCV1_z799R [Acanthocystis turfacea chlorella virus 1]ABT16933.1 hypothetical protein ATCV1_z799R [Acanthocystis turfacea chlorella virus 1]